MAAAPLDRVKALLAALPREDQEDIQRFMQDILMTPEEVEAREQPIATLTTRKAGREVTYTFRNEWIRCGKDGCKCSSGQFHGPYTYKYWREKGRVRKSYVGKAGGSAEGVERPLTRPGGKGPAARARKRSAASSSGPTARASGDP